MRIYCKAYKLKDLRQFSEWVTQSNEDGLSDEDIVYLWDDFTVVKNPFDSDGVLFNTVTPQWQDFCRTTLQFEVPADVRQAHEQSGSSTTA